MSKKAKIVKRKSIKRKSVKRKSIKRKNVKHGGNSNNTNIPDNPTDVINRPLPINKKTTSNSTNVGVPPNGNPVNTAGWFGAFLVIIPTIGYLVLK